MRVLHATPLTAAGFAAYGDVIAADPGTRVPMNDGRFARFDALSRVEGGAARIGIVRALQATALPYEIDRLERHPGGSQAFVPLSPLVFVVAVAAPGDGFDPGDIVAFVSNGRQGVTYRAGTWHMPLIALEAGQEFLVIDQGSTQATDTRRLDEPVQLAGLD